MWNEIAAWQEILKERPDFSAKTIALYTQDARRFATWVQHEHPGLKTTEVTSTDAKTYRDYLLAKRYALTTINRALISLMLFFDTINGTNPFRHLIMIEIVGPAPRVLSKTEWNAVRRCAESAARRDHGLALALSTLFRYAGPHVSEVAVLQVPDVQISARHGLLMPKHSLILQPTDWIALRCPFQLLSNYWVMLISRRRRSTHGFPPTTWHV